MMKAVCVFCGSSTGADPRYVEAAKAMGGEVARRGLTLVYGGARVGPMGALADAALAAGGDVIGVIPKPLMGKEVAHAGLTQLRIVNSMHDRKALMAELSDGFVALPGGMGTMEELFEVFTWGQLGLHAKPAGLLNTAGYYDPLIKFFDHAAKQGF